MDFVARTHQGMLDEVLNLEFVLDQQESHHSILLRLDRPCSYSQSPKRIPSIDEVFGDEGASSQAAYRNYSPPS
jgi:hypothetical protein